MTIAALLAHDVKTQHAQLRPVLGNPQELADIMNGRWSSTPQATIEAIRQRPDKIEDGLKNFLFVPELFAKPRGANARAALLASTDALAKGAIGIIATERPRNLSPSFPCLLVSDVSYAIGRLAEYRRRQSRAKFIAVTGSVGKSTTKNMIHLLASSNGPALRSIANYNAGIESIQFTLSNLSRGHSYCVAEFSEVGKLEEQLHMYRPQVALITNVLLEHVGRMERQGFTGDQVIRRLVYLAAGVARHMEPGGICILNADEPNFDLVAEEVRKSLDVRIQTFGRGASNDVRILSIESDAAGSDIIFAIGGREYSYRLGVPGTHMAVNSLAAVTAGYAAGIPLEPALHMFQDFATDSRRGVRLQIPWKNGFITIRDESVSSSLPSLRSTFAQLELERPKEGGRQFAVLGQIGELGRSMPDDMATFAVEAEATPVDRFYTIGSDIRLVNEGITNRDRVAPHFQTLDQLEKALRKELQAGDTVVFKCTRTPANISLRQLVDRMTKGESTPVTANSTKPLDLIRRIIVGGDTYFGETYQEKRAKLAELNYLEAFGYDYSGKYLAPLMQRADFTVVNLECALTEQSSSKLDGRKDYILRGDPQKTVDALKNLNVGGVLLGNNHSMDYLAGGLKETLDHVERAGLSVSGAGENRQKAQQPILKEFDVDGIPFKLAILSGYEYNSSHEELGFFAGDEKMGVNNLNIDRLKHQIASLRSQGYFVVLSPHWGSNYCFRSYSQSRLARRFIDLGADLILGHGPHMMNELAQVDGVWVIYSLGNLIFNSEGEYLQQGVQPYSLVAELELTRQGNALKGYLNLYPIVSCNQLTQFQPTFADSNQFEQVVGMLKAMHYDRDSFFNDISLHEIDGRRCMTMKIF